jgi:translation initiation factor IF-1
MDRKMRKNEQNANKYVELSGVVVEALPFGWFMVKVENSTTHMLCYLSGKVRQSGIAIVTGDSVVVRSSPNDLSKGRICYRF